MTSLLGVPCPAPCGARSGVSGPRLRRIYTSLCRFCAGTASILRGHRGAARPSVDAVRVLVVTNMYPSRERPWLGPFVRDQVEAFRRRDDLDVELFAFGPG